MAVKLGSTDITAIYHGSTLIADLFSGSTNVGISGSPPAPTTDPFWQETTLLLQDALTDDSSYGQTLTYYGNAGLDADSRVGNYSFLFNGTSDKITATADSSLELDADFTIEFWAKTTQSYGSGGRRFYCIRQSGTRATNAIIFGTTNGGVNAIFNYAGTTIRSSGVTVNDGNWHHYAATRLGSSMTLWVDGVSRATGTSSVAASQVGLVLAIGHDHLDPNGKNFVGRIDGLRVTKGHARYTSAFTPPAAAFPTAEPVDEFFSDTVLLLQDSLADDSYQGQTVTITGNTALDSSNAKVGNYGIAFDGAGDYIQTTVDSSLHITGDCTIEFWMKSSGPNSQRIVSHRTNGYSDTNLLGVFLSSGKPYFRIGPDIMNGNTVVNDGQWHHIACVRSGSNQYIFVDGAVDATRTTTSYSFNPIGLQLYIGRDPFDSQYFNGVLDGFRFTNGTARYTAAFTPSDEPFARSNGDPEFANVSLLVQEDLADESLNGLTVTWPSGFSQTTDNVSGTYGILVSGNGTAVRAILPTDTALEFTGDFTVEGWFKVGSPDYFGSFLHNTWNTNWAAALAIGSGFMGGKVRIAFNNAAQFYIDGTTDLRDGQWHHVAATRTGTTVRLFVDGVQEATGTSSNVLSFSGGHIGDVTGQYANNNDNEWGGTFDMLRLTKACRYTANFTPPTTEFPN